MLEFRFICRCTPVGFLLVFAGGARRGLLVQTLSHRWLQQGARVAVTPRAGVAAHLAAERAHRARGRQVVGGRSRCVM